MRHVLTVLVACSLFIAGAVFGALTIPDIAVAQIDALRERDDAYAALYDRLSPSVVSLEVAIRSGGRFITQSTGTGFVLDTDGHLITNYHVVEGGDRIAVVFVDGKTVRAEVVGLDAGSDLAVLKVDLPAQVLRPVTFADRDSIRVGQTALALGSPFGERWTLTSGIISAQDRTIEGIDDYEIGAVIQTDAAINPGNSGGPLLDLNGHVLGVNSQIVTGGVRANAGVGFAVPGDLVQRVAADLIANGRVRYSYLGIEGQDINIDWMEEYGLANDLRGVVVTRVLPGAPADRAGMLPQNDQQVDVIIAVNDVPVYGISGLTAYLAGQTKPGDTVTITVRRDGADVDLSVDLVERPPR